MPSVIYYGQSSNRKNMSACREQIGDGVALTTRDVAANNFRRIDGKFSCNRPYNELIGLVEDSFYGERVAYIKNTSGGSWTAGTLLETSTTLTSAGSCTAPNITAGASVVVTLGSITGTIEAGSLCQFTDADSPNPVQYAICTAVGSGTNRTFDELPYAMTTPSVVVIPAIAATVATNASGGEAKWVVGSTIANNGYAFVYGAAYISGIDTSGYSAIGSKVYLGTAGASTPTIPTTATATGQRVGQVVIKNATTGAIKYFPKERQIEKVANGGLQTQALTSAHLFVGNGSNFATDTAISGEATITNAGVVTLSNIIPRSAFRIATQTVTDSTTLTTDDTLTATLISGHKYIFKLKYQFTVISTSGAKVDLNGGTATATTINGDWSQTYNNAFGGSSVTALTTAIAGSTGASGRYTVNVDGYILCNAGGTFKPRFAQQTETGAAESVIAGIGSFLTITDLG